jgi:curved DNA-binding protein CbpA
MQQRADGFSDHYEALQLSPNADSETIGRVYRILAKRYHPDNQQTGDSAKFATIAEAHRVLSDPEQRAAYDARYEADRGAVLKIIDEASGPNPFAADQRMFDAILSLLYVARRRDPNNGGIGIVQLERMVGCPAEHLEFHVWYLREKQVIQRLENGLFSITAHGVDTVIAQDTLSLRRDRLIADKSVRESDVSDSKEVVLELT